MPHLFRPPSRTGLRPAAFGGTPTPRVEEGLTPLSRRAVAPFITSEQLSEREQETFLPEEFGTAFQDLRTALASPQEAAGPLIQTLLQALEPGFEEERGRQADLFRKAGAFADPTRLAAQTRLAGRQGQRRTQTGVQGLLSFLGPILQGRQSALASIPTLSRTADVSRSRGFGFGPQPSRGGGGGGGGGARPALRARGGGGGTGGINFAPQFNLGPTGEAVPAAPAGTPSFGATAFAPGGADIAPGQTSFSNADLAQFQDFAPIDQDFLFQR